MSFECTTGFEVSAANAMFARLVHQYSSVWLRLGNLETRILSEEIAKVNIRQPVFIAGLARSGSTILLELLASLYGVCTHRYRDFPAIFTPYWWNWFVDRASSKNMQPVERSHRDRIKVTSESPEAMEEAIWTAFFPHLHNPERTNVLDKLSRCPQFDQFYCDHIRTLMLVRGGSRYVSKGNYNISRLGYLLNLFPDARFVIPIREPAAHIASLMKQHVLFSKSCKNNPRAVEHLRQVGHFEFGLDRCPINMGDERAVAEILSLWRNGEEVRGWACYWSHVYASVFDLLESDSQLAKVTMLIRYEDLCQSPHDTVRAILSHGGFEDEPEKIREFCNRISAPEYYNWPFTDADLAIVHEGTTKAASRYGYP